MLWSRCVLGLDTAPRAYSTGAGTSPRHAKTSQPKSRKSVLCAADVVAPASRWQGIAAETAARKRRHSLPMAAATAMFFSKRHRWDTD